MARTKASVGAKIATGKSSKSRCSAAPAISSGTSTGSTEKSSRGSGGGNPVCPRETPKWQKPITNFFINKHDISAEGDGEVATSSNAKPKAKPKRNIIHSDDEASPEKPKNKVLDETIELQELDGESSHKIEEYYPKGTKGKGVGKKTKETTSEDSNSATEIEDRIQNGENETENNLENGETETKDSSEDSENETDNEKENAKNVDKENIDTNKEAKEKDSNSNVTSEKDSTTKSRNKREREDVLEDGNVSKKIKV